ncbi:4802_t:CDS:2 [Funneliformis caledonium]|uniref:4802_t:CDS:1 n=1 Tax=Funneliformis caledonium TaxID=1117310 RepID=A0A9N9HIF4_9GLOM|nr:4802_t:CDS:2 [Funneliformis caledonium]
MSNFFELPSEHWTFEKIAAHYCFESEARVFDRIKKDLTSRSNMKDDSALLAKQLVTSDWKLAGKLLVAAEFLQNTGETIFMLISVVSLMISPVANLFNKLSFLLLYNTQREATISTYTDGAKSMAKVRTDILNNIDHVSSFKRPHDLEKDDTNPRKRPIQNPSASASSAIDYDEPSASDNRPSSSSEVGDDELSDNEISPFELDLVKFDKAYSELDPNCMWILKSGRKVEEVIYKFTRNLPGETCLHSFIINDADTDAESLFSTEEWDEITNLESKDFPNLERSLKDLMKKYTVDNIKQLQKLILEPFVDEYDNELHFDHNYINYAYRSMLFLWQKAQNPFIDSKLEGWYQMNIWGLLIDPAFDNQNFELARGESMSFASSDRKNHKRTINDRKIGRKGDGVFRLSGDRLEFGATEAGRKWEGKSGTKYLNDSLKINKMLKDMIGQLAVACDGKEDLVRKLQVVGILHGANRFQLLIMDYPKGYISRVKHRKVHTVAGRLNKSEPLAYTLKEILCAKAIINQTLDMINTKNNVNLENFLDDSDEEGYRTPPRTVATPKTFITPKTKRTLDVINNDSE